MPTAPLPLLARLAGVQIASERAFTFPRNQRSVSVGIVFSFRRNMHVIPELLNFSTPEALLEASEFELFLGRTPRGMMGLDKDSVPALRKLLQGMRED
jgi:hypothetical protein